MRLRRIWNTAVMLFLCLLFMAVTAEKAEAISGSGTDEDPFVLTTAADIAAMHNKLDAHYALGADIDLFGWIHDPIGNGAEGAFTGSLDGRGHTIRRLELELTEKKYVGLFGYLEGSVSNLKLEDVKIVGGRYTGAVAGNIGLGGSVRGCSVLSGSVSVSDAMSAGSICVGGITGLCEGTVDRCSNAAAVSRGKYSAYVGGLIGRAAEALEISGSKNAGSVDGNDITGGLIGKSEKTTILLDCSNAGTVDGYNDTGGLLGRAAGTVRLQRCSNGGNILGNIDACGGLVGSGDADVTAEQCRNTGEIGRKELYNFYGGGIIGRCGGTAAITDCSNSGTVRGRERCGGIAGELARMEVRGCRNDGDCAVKDNNINHKCGGIVGCGDGSISACKNYGDVGRGYVRAGSIAASYTSGCRVENCINYGNSKDFSCGTGGGNINYGQLTNAGRMVSVSINDGQERNAVANIAADSGVMLNGRTSVYCSDLRYPGKGRGYPLAQLQDPASTAYAAWSLPGEWIVLEGKNSGLPLPAEAAEMDLMDQSLLILQKGESQSLNAPFAVQRWSSSSAVATCKEGTVTAQNVGTALVSAYDGTGRQANCVVFVYERRSAVTMRKTLTVTAGSNTTLTTDLPDEDPQGIIWSSSDTTVATVGQDGIVSAKKPGQAIITATLPLSGVSASCTVTVQGTAVSSLKLSQTSATLQCGQTLTLTYTTGSQYDDKTVTWSSSNEAVAEVKDGLVSAKAPGIAIISCKAASGVEAVCTVTVKQNGASLTIDRSELSLELGKTVRLTATLLPENSTEKVSWSSTNNNVVSVDENGVLTPKRIGQAAVYAYTPSGLRASCTVTVYSAMVWPTAVTLSQRILRPTVGQEIQLYAQLTPQESNRNGIVWASSNESVAEVTVTGLVRAVGTGTAEIRATTENGLYDICTVKVTQTSSAEFVVESGRISQNDTADTAVYLTKNPGVASFTMAVRYDAAHLQPIAVRTGALLAGAGTLSSNVEDTAESGVLRVTWYSDTDVTDDGELFVITWQSIEADGTTSVIDLDYGEDDVCNSEKVTVPVRKEAGELLLANYMVGDIYTDGTVNMKDIVYFARWFNNQEQMSERQEKAADVYYDGVLNVKDLTHLAQILSRQIVQQDCAALMMLSADETEPFCISVSDAAVDVSGETEIIVSGSNCPGIAALRFVLELPAGYEILAVEAGEVLNGGTFKYDAENRCVMWYSSENQILDGVLFTIRVRAGAECPEHGVVQLHYDEGDYFEAGTYAPVAISVGSGSIEDKRPVTVEKVWYEGSEVRMRMRADRIREVVIFVADYDEGGRLMKVTTSRQLITSSMQNYSISAPLEGAANRTLFVVDAQCYIPLCSKSTG